MAIRLGQPNTLKSGPWSGVYNTTDPFDAAEDRLLDARNVYIPDPDIKSGTYSRPGFVLLNGGNAIYTSATTFKGQAVYTHFGLDGTPTNFCVFGGQLFRLDSTLTIATNVTPVGVTINGNVNTRVFFASMGGAMAVNDGVNRPWVASNLSSTPITGTYIDFDGAGTAWKAFGPPVVFGGSGFWVLTSYNSVAARLDIAWTEPNTWTIGYQQPTYDNRWTLEQTGTTPLYALAGTNVALYYWRQRSIGSISGAVGPDLASTATHDAISTNVGTESPQTIIQFGDSIYFCDVIGRPWRFVLGSAPIPIWLQMRGIVEAEASGVAYPGVTAVVSSGAFEPTLNLYCVAIWTSAAGTAGSPTEWHCFDAKTGTYMGRWSIGPANPGVFVDCMGAFIDNNGRGQLIVLGSATAGGTTGYAWGMNSLFGVPDMLTTEDTSTFLTTEDDVTNLTIEGQIGVWLDNGEVPLITVTPDAVGYSEEIIWLYDRATIVTGNASPVSVTVTTPNAENVAEGTPTPVTSADGVFRSVCGLDLQGRGAHVTISPTTANSQWNLQRLTLTAIPSLAMPDDA